MKMLDFLLQKVKVLDPITMAVAVAQDSDVLLAVKQAVSLNLVKAILVGDQQRIEQIAKEINFDLSHVTIVDEADPAVACAKAVKLVALREAHILMKGLVDTAIILRAVLHREDGLRTDSILSHVSLAQVDAMDRMFLITDAAMNMYPDLEAKKGILRNSLVVANAIGINHPKVGVVCAVEKVNPKMPCTLDAQALSDAAKAGEFENCDVDGPFALDNAVSVEAAKHKGIKTPNAGMSDILLMPNIEAGNMLYKSVTFFAGGNAAGLIVGAKAPIVLTSRADSDQNKLVSIALAAVMAAHLKNLEE